MQQSLLTPTLMSLLAVFCCTACGGEAVAQSSSLLRGNLPPAPEALTIENSSWTFQPLRPPARIKKHDILTIIVEETSRVISQAEYERERRGEIDAVLEDNPVLQNLNLRPSPQSGGDPRLKASIDSTYETDADLRTRGSITFRMAAKVVDIRPNGNLVIEGHKQFRNNDEIWERSLTGIVRPESVGEGNIVQSKDIAELRVFKRERGEVRDGYRRGWLLKMWDAVRVF